jgi:anaphase-promoting complex subunit 4
MDLILHCAHKSYSSHTLITASEANSGIELALIPMDIRFVAGSSEYLSLVASKSAALQNLLRYVDRVQNLMKAEWQSTQDLPQRFLSNINETLAEKQGCDIVQALYHSVLTGHHFPAVKEWLVDELAERVS